MSDTPGTSVKSLDVNPNPFSLDMTKQLSIQKHISLSAPCHKVLLVKGKLWCFMEDCIEIRDTTSGDIIKSLDVDVHDSYGADITDSGHVLIAAKDAGLLAIDPETDQVKNIDDGYYHSVQAKGDHLLHHMMAIKEDHDKIYIVSYHKNAESQEYVQESALQVNITTDGQHSALTLALAGDRIYVCSAVKHTVYWLNYQGKVLKEFGKSGNIYASKKKIPSPGELNYPLLCCRDASGAMLIADHDHDRFQILQPDKQDQPWSVLNISGGIVQPSAGTVDGNGRMFCCGNEPDELYIVS